MSPAATHEEIANALNVPVVHLKQFLAGMRAGPRHRLIDALSPLCPRPVHDPGSDEEKRDPPG